MGTQEEKQFDDFIRKIVRDTGLEQPVPDLRNNIMLQIRSTYSRTANRALIPKSGWAILTFALAAFSGLVYYNPLGVKALAFEVFPRDLGDYFGEPSSVTLYAVIVLGLMMCLQVVLLKRRIERTYENK